MQATASPPEIKIETSGMDPEFEKTLCSIVDLLPSQTLTSQDAKAKFIVKEMERHHSYDWACMVEPVHKFVQCFGVSKRPDQYCRLSAGNGFRVRVWRLNEFY